MATETRLVRVDLDGSLLAPAWRRIAAEVMLPPGWTDTMLAQSAAKFYEVPIEQVSIEDLHAGRSQYDAVKASAHA